MKTALAVLLSCTGAAGIVQADARLDYTVQGDCAVEPASLRVSGSRLRFDHAMVGQDSSSLFDGLEETLIHLDHGRRRFHEVEVDIDAAEYTGDVATSSMHFVDKEMAKAQKQMDAACKDLEKQGMACPQIAGMDMQSMMQMAQGMAAAQAQGAASGPAQDMDPDALMEAMNAQARAPRSGASSGIPTLPAASQPLSVSDTGRDETIAGATCRWNEERRGDVLVREQCLVAPEALPLSDRDRAGMKRALVALLRYGDAFAPVREKFSAGGEPTAAFRGLVLAQRCYDARGESSGQARASLGSQPIDEEVFEIPAGYEAERMD
jgi:hypothetical protein